MATPNPASIAAAADAFVYVEARHIDALTEAVKGLSRHMTQGAELTRNQISAVRSLDASITRLADILSASAVPGADQTTPGGRSKSAAPVAGDRRKTK